MEPTARSSEKPSLEELGYETNGSSEWVTQEGKCTLDTSSDPVVVTCQSEQSDGALVEVNVEGLDSDDIVTATQEFKDGG